MTEKAYKEWIETEYLKKKQSTIEALRSLSVEQLTKHIREYKEFIISFSEENELYIKEAKIEEHVINQLSGIEALEKTLEYDITNQLAHIMLEEEIIVHVIQKAKEEGKKLKC
ncbi:MAG: hypothetical protein GX312_02800 [Candidatus Phytoplasma sp.]|nr:hypothetical protein [Phytoplasma sp.]